ncbi:ABC transporter permease [Saccharopolyspora indica]|uniref:ABC transporter permease n=1 Tax=Saccharopolyspora indica TaxID=1229659 RepID=UPI0022EA3D8A|nr:ABC transporter permease [Saccharopolyspora indica]MDA3644131.1 ABC transporter permease [Saccharopolyspora indica]
MLRYFAHRLLQAIVVLWATFTVSFLILYALPGDAVSIVVGPDAGSGITPEQLAQLRHEYGFDRPLIVQYATRLGQLFTGDLGVSISSGQPVAAMIADALPATVQIAGVGLLFAIVLGGGIALAATYFQWHPVRQLLLALPPIGVAVPSFWLGMLLLQLFSFRLKLFPAVGNEGFASVVLPAITLGVPTGALIAQVLARSLNVTLREPYIDTARAKGSSPLRIHFRHALRNSLLPALTMGSIVVGNLLAGSVVTETVFSRTGIGRLMSTAVTNRDVPVVAGLVVFSAAVFVITNLVIDLIYPLVDPRIVLRRGRNRVAAAEENNRG